MKTVCAVMFSIACMNNVYACDEHKQEAQVLKRQAGMYTYRVYMTRTEQKAGPRGSFTAEYIEAHSPEMAKNVAQGRFPGYRATGAHRQN